MTDASEADFSARVEAWLDATFGQAAWTDDVYLEATSRRPDYWVDLGSMAVAVEVENDWEAAIEGIGQAMLYASHSPNTWPLVVVPDGHIDQPEAHFVRERTPVALVAL